MFQQLTERERGSKERRLNHRAAKTLLIARLAH